MAYRFVKIDDALRAEHSYLAQDDECYFLGEYHPRAGFKAGVINDMISNFKKSVEKRDRPEYRFKEAAILNASQMLRGAVGPNALGTCTFIPIPPSKAAYHPLYDDRMLRVLLAGHPPLDARPLLVMRESTRAHHDYAEGERRPTPDGLRQLLIVDEAYMAVPLRPTVFLFDDVITNGTHFKACKQILLERIPDIRVIGLFIGRRKASPPVAFDIDGIAPL